MPAWSEKRDSGKMAFLEGQTSALWFGSDISSLGSRRFESKNVKDAILRCPSTVFLKKKPRRFNTSDSFRNDLQKGAETQKQAPHQFYSTDCPNRHLSVWVQTGLFYFYFFCSDLIQQ